MVLWRYTVTKLTGITIQGNPIFMGYRSGAQKHHFGEALRNRGTSVNVLRRLDQVPLVAVQVEEDTDLSM
jgi:hypothetical protein